MRTPSRRAFTLVELLVVIAIISILAGLLLPALNSAIETARQADCTNRMKQVMLQASLYENQFDVVLPFFMTYPENPWSRGDAGNPGFALLMEAGLLDENAFGKNWDTTGYRSESFINGTLRPRSLILCPNGTKIRSAPIKTSFAPVTPDDPALRYDAMRNCEQETRLGPGRIWGGGSINHIIFAHSYDIVATSCVRGGAGTYAVNGPGFGVVRAFRTPASRQLFLVEGAGAYGSVQTAPCSFSLRQPYWSYPPNWWRARHNGNATYATYDGHIATYPADLYNRCYNCAGGYTALKEIVSDYFAGTWGNGWLGE